MSEFDSFQVTVTSDSSSSVFKNNTLSSFTTILAQPLHFERVEEWGVAIKQVILPPVAAPKSVATTANLRGEIQSNLLVYIDIIDSQVFGDTLSKVALILPAPYLKSHHFFENPIYLPLSRADINSISVTLCDKYSQKYPFEASLIASAIVLHFKKVL